MSSFRGKVSVITGAASGIGQALALALARRGSALALSDVNETGLAETVERARASGVTVTSAHVDVAERAAVEAWASDVLAEHGQVDLVVNNAGVTLCQTVAEMSYEDLHWIVDINFWGVVHGTKSFLPHMLERRQGHIVNVSSVLGIVGVQTQAAYSATKFAVRGFTEALRLELADTGVAVTTVHPGGVRTNIMRASRFYRDVAGATDHTRAAATFDRIARLTPEGAARILMRGIERREPRVLIGLDAQLIDRVQRLLPVRYGNLVQGLRKRFWR